MKNTIADKSSNFLGPILSDIKPTGKLKMMPANGEMAEIKPMMASLPPSALMKRGRTGLFEIVVEKIPKNPIVDNR
jgi:hypothetical protein